MNDISIQQYLEEIKDNLEKRLDCHSAILEEIKRTMEDKYVTKERFKITEKIAFAACSYLIFTSLQAIVETAKALFI